MSRLVTVHGLVGRWTAFAVALGLFSVSLAAVFGQSDGSSYVPGPAPFILPIEWQCQEDVPTPLDRTDFGLNEQVDFWIDPTTWVDEDYSVDPYGNLTPVYDSLGLVIWSVTGAGTIYPTIGYSTTLTVDEVTQDSPVSVEAQVWDSETLGLDPPVTLQAGGGGGMMGQVPTGIQGVVWYDDLGVGAPGPPNNQVGARSRFWYQVTPAFVNFSATQFQENIPAIPLPPPYAAPVWPDGTPVNIGANIVPFNVANVTFGPPNAQVLQPNMVRDRIGTGPWPVGQLGDPPQAFSYSVPVPLEYSSAGAWIRIASTNSKWHPREFQANLQARVGLDPGSGPVWGGLQGPWQ